MHRKINGFTLIELSIVLVIIGLIVGGVLAGQDLIRAAAIRATVAQIESYNTAVNTFRGKYGYLPGDIPAGPAAQFGFISRGQYSGQGDGNGILQGVDANAANEQDPWNTVSGETGVFWTDLSQVGLIAGSFTAASITTLPGINITGTAINNYLPQAKIGKGNYIFVWEGGWAGCFANNENGSGDGKNYFGLSEISQISAINNNGDGEPSSTVSLTPQEAYGIDKKVDDGMPQTGGVMALYPSASVSTNSCWAYAGGSTPGAQNPANGGPTNAATPGSSSTCYDNGNGTGPQQYSLSQNNGSNTNCALSFRFQ